MNDFSSPDLNVSYIFLKDALPSQAVQLLVLEIKMAAGNALELCLPAYFLVEWN